MKQHNNMNDNIEVYSHGELVYSGLDLENALEVAGEQAVAQYTLRSLLENAISQYKKNSEGK
jgi:hypothetical protein